ncbi:O-antigen ligase family protein [Dankookia sp. GCM10030260]|uniref:O-antigen ligase family protein n=1 Tax=Dankookia sp. GCM10030260 TaxID=3273390 RepID=UPI00361C8CED
MSHSDSAAIPRYGRRLRTTTLHDRYCSLLCFVLVGYAVSGKGFAYLGLPPLYIGEIALILGLLVLVRTGCGSALLASPASLLLVLLMTWVVLRMIPYVGSYGISAARDAVVVIYGLFAFIVMAVMLERPDRFRRVVTAYSRFAWIYGFIGLALLNSLYLLGTAMPTWPGNGQPIIFVRSGELASHLSGAAAFALLGLMRTGRLWPIIMLISLGFVSVSRGAMLAFVLPNILAVAMARQKRRVLSALMVGVSLFGLAYAAGVDVPLPGGRSFGPQQIVDGVESIIGTSNVSNLDGTKAWRLNWWNSIVNYTLHGPYFWTGKGFGMNLAEEDGYVIGLELGGPTVRSPHNVHMTILARSGVPGLVLWLTTLAVWLGTLLNTARIARRRGDGEWADVFIWIACYCTAIVIDASFDVALEGPMLGIWFWCLFGLGIAGTMIYRTELLGRRRQVAGSA